MFSSSYDSTYALCERNTNSITVKVHGDPWSVLTILQQLSKYPKIFILLKAIHVL